MRLRRIDRYLLLLAGLFVVAILCPTDLPGEEILPSLYQTVLYRPFLAQAAAAAAEEETDIVRLRSDLEAARLEIAKLQEQVHATRVLHDYFLDLEWESTPLAIPGWVFSVDADEFRKHFHVRSGSLRQVKEGMPVVTGRALLGLVLRKTPLHVVVQRVDDPGFRIEVEVQTAGGPFACVAEGSGDRGLDLRLVRKAASLESGQPVFTSSYHPQIPPGLLVGWIGEVEEDKAGGPPRVSVRPAASLARLAQVEVLGRR